MSYGVTDKGFILKTQSEILKELQDDLKKGFGNDIILDEDQPLGIIAGVISQAVSELWEAEQASYSAYDPDNAFGNGLSDLVQINDIERLQETSSTVTLVLHGDNGLLIPAGSACSTDEDLDGNKIVVTTIEDVVLQGAGVDVAVVARCTCAGQIKIPANSIINIDSLILGWDSVNNPNEGDEGRNEETDVELRIRRKRSVGLGGQSIIDAMYSTLYNVPNVKYVRIYENDKAGNDPITGQAPFSFQCVVDGGIDEDIAKGIFNTKPTGIPSAGNTEVIIYDSSNFPHPVKLTRPTEVDIYLDIVVTSQAPVTPTLADDIKANILDYVSIYNTFDEIPVNELITPIQGTLGVKNTIELKADRTSNPQKSYGDIIAINFNEKSKFTTDNIQVRIIT